jgi:hypothetical protein
MTLLESLTALAAAASGAIRSLLIVRAALAAL